jgi:RecA-family ATPase
MTSLELLAKEAMQEVDEPGGINSQQDIEPLDLSQWTLERFNGEPVETQFLVDSFIPLGIAGTLYSAGGTGKSTLALDLSIRIAIAEAIPAKWLDKFDVLTGGKVLYFSAEEPENVLHKRIKSICEAIARETETHIDILWSLCLKNLFVVNLWGTAKQLFDVKTNSLEPSGDYWQIYNTLKTGDFKLCVFDTRSRLSGAEGSGNALVSREVSFYEKLAADFGCTVLILHHTNKVSYSGESNAAGAQRGESSFLDCLRLGIYLQTITEDIAAANSIPVNDRFKYLSVTQSKSNYTSIQEPLIIERDGWHFSLTDIKCKTSREEKTAKQEERDVSKVCEIIKENPSIDQKTIVKKLKGVLSFHRCRDALLLAKEMEMISAIEGARNKMSYSISKT